MKPEEIKNLQEENKALKAENETSKKEIQKRDDQIADQVAELEALQAKLDAAKEIVEEKEPIIVACSWKSPHGKTMKKEVTITAPKVRIPNAANPVSTEGLLKIATGKKPTEAELVGLEKMTKATAVEIITKWVQIGAGFLEEK